MANKTQPIKMFLHSKKVSVKLGSYPRGENDTNTTSTRIAPQTTLRAPLARHSNPTGAIQDPSIRKNQPQNRGGAKYHTNSPISTPLFHYPISDH
jgi:hypothetical protein